MLVKYVGDYIFYGNIIVSVLFDIGTAIKLYILNRKSNPDWSKQRATLEILFLLQNFSNVFTCIILLISYFIFVYACAGGGQFCMDIYQEAEGNLIEAAIYILHSKKG
uniref:7TM GPCR serpentine receptor class x (Srx) domain-containing protein n=1 Tax=Acrobeloides nanus TaxID=290746 RepID=A0A914D2C9_9BILA